MRLPKYLTTVTTFSKVLAMTLFIILPILGFWLGMSYQSKLNYFIPNNKNENQQTLKNNISLPPTTGAFISPTSSFTNMQKSSELNWKNYTNEEFGISFDYPDNLNHFDPSNGSALKLTNGKITLFSNMAYIFQVEKIITNDSVEIWWDKNDSSKHNGNGLMPAKMTKTSFHNKTAYYFEILDKQQVPSDFYIIPFEGYFLQISFEKITPLRQVLSSCLNSNSCSSSDLLSAVDFDNYYREFDDLIIQRILSSVEFKL